MSAPLEGGTSVFLLLFTFAVQKTNPVLYSPVKFLSFTFWRVWKFTLTNSICRILL